MKRVRGIKHGDILRASFNSRVKKGFKNLKETNVLLLVSIKGNEYCEGDYLAASITTALNEHGKVTVLIADEVYWNNLKPLDPISNQQALKNQARALGDDFIHNNLDKIVAALGIAPDAFKRSCAGLTLDETILWLNTYASRLGKSFNIVRWADWTYDAKLNWEAFSAEKLVPVMAGNSVMQESIEETAGDFAKRHASQEDKALWLECSRSYLQEETPAVIWLAASRGYHFIAYPGEMIEPFVAAHTLFINPSVTQDIPNEVVIRSENSLVNWLDIHFRRSQSKVQLLQTSLLATENVVSPKPVLSVSVSPFLFLASKPVAARTQEDVSIIEWGRNIMESSGDHLLKIQVLLSVLSALSNGDPGQSKEVLPPMSEPSIPFH